MRRNIPLLTLTIAVLLVPFGISQTAQKPRLPNIPSNELIAWTQQQTRLAGQSQAELQLLLVAIAQGTAERLGLIAQPDRREQGVRLITVEAFGTRPEIRRKAGSGHRQTGH